MLGRFCWPSQNVGDKLLFFAANYTQKVSVNMDDTTVKYWCVVDSITVKILCKMFVFFLPFSAAEALLSKDIQIRVDLFQSIYSTLW